jgi:hypothetical protein
MFWARQVFEKASLDLQGSFTHLLKLLLTANEKNQSNVVP